MSSFQQQQQQHQQRWPWLSSTDSKVGRSQPSSSRRGTANIRATQCLQLGSGPVVRTPLYSQPPVTATQSPPTARPAKAGASEQLTCSLASGVAAGEACR